MHIGTEEITWVIFPIEDPTKRIIQIDTGEAIPVEIPQRETVEIERDNDVSKSFSSQSGPVF